MAEDTDTESKLGTYAAELENGIFGMVVSLCQQLTMQMSLEDAKARVITYLESLIEGLKQD